MLKHYVTMFYPGAFFSEDSTREVGHRDFKRIRPPKDCFAFQFFDQEEVQVEMDGEVLKGKPKNHSKRYYPNAVFVTLKEAKGIQDRDGGHLYDNLAGNGYKFGIKTQCGNYQSYDKGDILYDTSTKEIIEPPGYKGRIKARGTG